MGCVSDVFRWGSTKLLFCKKSGSMPALVKDVAHLTSPQIQERTDKRVAENPWVVVGESQEPRANDPAVIDQFLLLCTDVLVIFFE